MRTATLEQAMEFARALDYAVSTAEKYAGNLRAVRSARVRFLVTLADKLTPVLDLLIDRGSDSVAVFENRLFLNRDGTWSVSFSDAPGSMHTAALDADKLGELRVDPAALVRSVTALLDRHSNGRDGASEILDREAKLFGALLELIDR